jgi:hypothetical protein
MAGGGDHTGAAGIAHVIMIVVGVITVVCRVFIMMWTLIGEDIIQVVIGMDMLGIIALFHIHNFNQIGEDGKITDIGRNKENGMFRVIQLDPNHRDSN